MEMWKHIPGYEGIYEASNLGRIRSAEGKTTFSARHGIVHWKQRVLKQKVYPNGRGRSDARITLWKNKAPHDYLVSRLIAMTWCAGYFDGATVNHINGNHMDNCADNLEWVSIRENVQHAFRTGLIPTQKACRLTDERGNEHTFRSMSIASQFLGKNHGYISGRSAKGYTTAFGSDGTKYVITGG